MSRLLYSVTCTLLLLLLIGCSSLPEKTVSLQNGGLILYSADADKKTLYVKDVIQNDNHRFCLTPSHDAVGADSKGIGATLGPATMQEGVSISDAKGELALGGRSPSVLITRELMYRACELTSNLNTDLPTTLKIYERFLQSVEAISSNQTEQGSAPLSLVEPAPLPAPAEPSDSSDSGSGDGSGDGSDDGSDGGL